MRIPAEEIERLVQGQEALSLKEAADLLNVVPKVIRSLIKDGTINAFRIADAGPFRIPREEIEKFIRGNEQEE